MRIQPINFTNYKRSSVNKQVAKTNPYNVSFGMANVPEDIKNYFIAGGNLEAERTVDTAIGKINGYYKLTPDEFGDILKAYRFRSDLVLKLLLAEANSENGKVPLVVSKPYYFNKAMTILDENIIYDAFTKKDKNKKTLMHNPEFSTMLRKSGKLSHDKLFQAYQTRDSYERTPVYKLFLQRDRGFLEDFSFDERFELFNVKDVYGKTPLHYSDEYSSCFPFEGGDRKKLLEIYLAKDNEGKTPLHNYSWSSIEEFNDDFKNLVNLQEVYCIPDENGKTLISEILSGITGTSDRFTMLKTCAPYLTQEAIQDLTETKVIDPFVYACNGYLDGICDKNQFYKIYTNINEKGEYEISQLSKYYLNRLIYQLDAKQLESILSLKNPSGETIFEALIAGEPELDSKMTIISKLSDYSPKEACNILIKNHDAYSEKCDRRSHELGELRRTVAKVITEPKLDADSSLTLLEMYRELFDDGDYHLIKNEILKLYN